MMTGYSEDAARHIAEVRALRDVVLPVGTLDGEDFVVAAKTVTQTEFQRNWDAINRTVRQGEHVQITRHGKPDLVVLSYEEYDALVRDRAENEKRP